MTVQQTIFFWKKKDAPSDRKLRLWACAACRQFWDLLPDTRSRSAIQVAEMFADGLANQQELADARRTAEGIFPRSDFIGKSSQRHLAAAKRAVEDGIPPIEGDQAITRATASAACGNALTAAKRIAGSLMNCWFTHGETFRGRITTQEALAQDIFDHAGCSLAIDPAWLLWNDSCIVKLAQAAYGDRELPSGLLDPSRLSILADALEEAGCTNSEVLAHLRGAGLHCRGCWVLDGLLGKE